VHLRRLPARAGLGWAVPAQGESAGRDIRMVYSSADAVVLAQKNPDKQVVFFAIGFETTTPPTAVAIKQAAALGLSNFSVLCCHVLTPSAISSILESPEVRQWGTVPLDGFIGPAHVSTIIGSRPYEFFAEEYRKPVVIAGFEPLDVMQAIRMLIRQVNEGRAEVENEFSRAVDRNGNLKAQQLVGEVFEMRKHFEWRGLNVLPYSALRIRSQFAEFDAEKRFSIWITSLCPTTRRANVAPSCAASNGRRTANCSARCAPRKTRLVPAWFPPKVPAPLTTLMDATRMWRDGHRKPVS
jgi:hydrogenase expression/formation protein HypD